MTTPTNGQAPYNWATDKGFSPNAPRQNAQPSGPRVQKQRTVNVNFGGSDGGGRANDGNGGSGAGQAPAATPNNHQGDGMIRAIERIEFRGPKDILACAKAVNRLGRELHFILSMRAEEIQAVLSTHKGTWYTFGAQSRIRARLVAMHLKVSAEAAKALGVGALKMAHAFDRHFVKPEQEAKRKKNGQQGRRQFNMEDV
uniref:TraA protein n=1 Tax=Streptomyces sp. FR1 TaxID=349971 RepID=I1VH46_9ACTN|nr:hypothetical protein [Streptomyces sp. FR1]AFI44044.1 TraA protein [Streptomyces sp. FR1]